MTRVLLTTLFTRHRLLLAVCLALLVIGILLPSQQAQATRSHDLPGDLTLDLRYPLTLPATANEQHVERSPVQQELNWQQFTVDDGDSLSRLFSKAGLSQQTLYQVMQSGDSAKQLTALHPGDKLAFGFADDGSLQTIRYPLDRQTTLLFSRQDDGTFHTDKQTKALEIRTEYAGATISSNFWNAGVSAGLDANLIMQLAAIFGWDVDFALDLRAGDEFSVVYETEYLDGTFTGYGNILAAEFVNRGQRLRAVRYKDGNYYAPDGHAMRKAFLRAPVNFKYISSSFNPRRLHPVTGKVRPHNGIDYAAKVGTPIMASGDGKVIKAGYNRFNGNYVFIRHGATYVTKYLHMHRRYAKLGKRVKQGEIIGTVGATGRVTGPHLHYEFLVNGVHRNPRTVDLPKSRPIAASKRADFLALSQPLLTRLEDNRRVMLGAVFPANSDL